jgi:1-deoxypentalenic acid 11beta-hydroxylase
MTRQGLSDLVVANEFLEDHKALDELYQRDGCLFFRDTLDHTEIRKVADGFISEFVRQGAVAAGPAIDWSSLNPGTIDVESLQGAVPYEAFWSSPTTRQLMETIFSEDVHVFKSTQLRWLQPGSKNVTPAHQDVFYFRPDDVPDVFRTFWVPVVDMDGGVGGLKVAPGSHNRGILDHATTSGVISEANRTGMLPQAKNKVTRVSIVDLGQIDQWAATEYHVGDVVVFNAYLVHAGLPNNSRNRIRISIDTRVQPASAPITAPTLLTTLQVRQNALTGKGWVPRRHR